MRVVRAFDQSGTGTLSIQAIDGQVVKRVKRRRGQRLLTLLFLFFNIRALFFLLLLRIC
jgi:hypothetical protein